MFCSGLSESFSCFTSAALEFAKDKVWEESFKTMDDQIYIFGKQFHKIWRLKDKVDVIICDSPLPISIVVSKQSSKKAQYYSPIILAAFPKSPV